MDTATVYWHSLANALVARLAITSVIAGLLAYIAYRFAMPSRSNSIVTAALASATLVGGYVLALVVSHYLLPGWVLGRGGMILTALLLTATWFVLCLGFRRRRDTANMPPN